MKTTFEQDFPAIFEKKFNRKMKKRMEKDELNRAADVMSSRTYKIMVTALEDLVSSKKGLLAAFRIWKCAVGFDAFAPQILIDNTSEIGAKCVSSEEKTYANDEDNSVYSRYALSHYLTISQLNLLFSRIMQSTQSINSETPEEAAKSFLKIANSSLHEQRFADCKS